MGLLLVPAGKWGFSSCGLGRCGSGACSSLAPSLLSMSMTHGVVGSTAASGEEQSSSRETCHSAAGDSCTFPHPRAGPNFTLGASTSGEPEKNVNPITIRSNWRPVWKLVCYLHASQASFSLLTIVHLCMKNEALFPAWLVAAQQDRDEHAVSPLICPQSAPSRCCHRRRDGEPWIQMAAAFLAAHILPSPSAAQGSGAGQRSRAAARQDWPWEGPVPDSHLRPPFCCPAQAGAGSSCRELPAPGEAEPGCQELGWLPFALGWGSGS